MCRMMGMVGGMPNEGGLSEFRELSASGNVLPGSSCGHGDGWGYAAFRGGVPVFHERSPEAAACDARFEPATEALRREAPDVLLAHLRKASQGTVNEANAHPFVRDGVAFCHNGGIRRSAEIPTFGLAPEGDTDSERFFLSILGRLRSGAAANLREAAEQAVAWVHDHLPYSSICFLMTDGSRLMAWRDHRDTLRPEETVPPANYEVFPRYYTLYHSETARAVCSQPLPALADDWALMKNKTMLELTP